MIDPGPSNDQIRINLLEQEVTKLRREVMELKNGAEPKKAYRDPSCPKCGLVLGDKMFYVCTASHCPVGLN